MKVHSLAFVFAALIGAGCAGGPDEAAACAVAGNPFGGGIGTEAEPFLLCTPQHLAAVMDSPSSHFLLSTDIDLQGVAVAPLGRLNVEAEPSGFSGVFDGGGRSIVNLRISDSAYSGLFRVIAPAGIVRNLTLVSAAISAEDTAGVLAGLNLGAIHTVHVVDGTVTSRAGGNLGCLVGSNNGSVTNSSASCAVAALHMQSGGSTIGGLIGWSYGGAVTACCATGSVTGLMFVGGLIGASFETAVTDSYSLGTITVDGGSAGGLIGNLVTGTISNSYAVSPVTGPGSTVAVAGLVGWFQADGALGSCYFNNANGARGGTGPALSGAQISGGTGLSDVAFSLQSSFANWDFENTWRMSETAQPFARPVLFWQK